VADTTTLIVAPLAAACGLCVAKMSGRGLGHTGGTLDKLESIPGYRVELAPEEFEAQVAEVGVAVIAQSPEVDPADKALYALRDVTGTVPSIPLIASSVVSKKIAGGARVIVVDVKCGSGAFMKTPDQAMLLARAISETGAELGRSISCVVTDMDAPLGMAVGNALEVGEAVAVLRGETEGPLADLSVELVAWLVAGAGLARGMEAARATARARLADGSALARFSAWITAQGGDGARLAEEPAAVLPAARVSSEVLAPADGFVARYDAERVGRAALALGAGRATKDAGIDPAAGLVLAKRVGEMVAAGEPLATLFAANEGLLAVGAERFLEAVTIGPEPPGLPLLVLAEVPAPVVLPASAEEARG
jgi:pyrimidine-nucleoside phosphorylase